MAIFEIAKNGIRIKNFFVKLIYLISRVFLAWTFLNFLAYCVLQPSWWTIWNPFSSRLEKTMSYRLSVNLTRPAAMTQISFFSRIRVLNSPYLHDEVLVWLERGGGAASSIFDGLTSTDDFGATTPWLL